MLLVVSAFLCFAFLGVCAGWLNPLHLFKLLLVKLGLRDAISYSHWIENTMANFAEWATEVWEYRRMILSSNHWLGGGWVSVAVQLPSRGWWQQEDVAWLRQIDLSCDSEHVYWVTEDSFCLLVPRLRDPTVTHVQDELCLYLLLVEPVTGTHCMSLEFRHAFLALLFWWQLLLPHALAFPEWRAPCCSSAFVSQTGLSCWQEAFELPCLSFKN